MTTNSRFKARYTRSHHLTSIYLYPSDSTGNQLGQGNQINSLNARWLLLVWLGALPLVALVTYINVFVGPAELVETPEGYEPYDWEYEKHPITRFLARNVLPSPQRNYEKMMHYWWELGEKEQFNRLLAKVKQVQSLKDDYRSWYYIPADGDRILRSREMADGYYEQLGSSKGK